MAQFGSGCLLLPGTGTHTTLLLTSPITATSFFPFGERIFYKRIYNPTTPQKESTKDKNSKTKKKKKLGGHIYVKKKKTRRKEKEERSRGIFYFAHFVCSDVFIHHTVHTSYV
jgi:hypothetical protein